MASGAGVRVRLYKNSASKQEPRLMRVPDAPFDVFLQEAGKKVGLDTAKFAYTANGAVIDDITLIREDEEIYLAETEGFFRQSNNAAASSSTPSGDSSRINVFKIAVMGPGGVGKSCLTIRYVKSTFVETYDPTIEDAFRHSARVDDSMCVLEILDTAGQEEFKCLAQQWVENKDGFLLVFALTDKLSFENVAKFYDIVHRENVERGKEMPPVVLVGNKCDLAEQRRVPLADAQGLAVQWKKNGSVEYVEASAKSNVNVDRAFEMLVRLMRGTTVVERRPRKGLLGAACLLV